MCLRLATAVPSTSVSPPCGIRPTHEWFEPSRGDRRGSRTHATREAEYHGAVKAARSQREIAVLGGGFQGCCIALALAERGARVTLYERNTALMTEAAVVNEGRMHLGYVYAADTTLATARMMIRGALAFGPFVERHVGLTRNGLALSAPTTYLVHRETQRPVDELRAYFGAVHRLVREAVGDRKDAYFGVDIQAEPRQWSSAERERVFDGSVGLAAFDTPEIALDPMVLGAAVRLRVRSLPAIETRLERTVRAVEDERGALCVVSDGPQGSARDRYDHVVNALWGGRLAVDATRGLRPAKQWIYRFKYGIRLRQPSGRRWPTVGVTLGPFGDVVAYENDTVYVSWYPACLEGISHAVTPPAWSATPMDADRARIVSETLTGMAGIIPSLRDVEANALDCTVKGGVIVAWGRTDIDDPDSELHRRYEIGVTSTGHYHSVDPGKLTMVPYFAEVCADRITPR